MVECVPCFILSFTREAWSTEFVITFANGFFVFIQKACGDGGWHVVNPAREMGKRGEEFASCIKFGVTIDWVFTVRYEIGRFVVNLE